MAKKEYQSNNSYLQIKNGKFAEYSKLQAEKTKIIKDSNGKEHHYYLFKSVYGHLTKIYIYEKHIGDTDIEILVVYITDKESGRNDVIEMSFNSNYAKSLIFKLPNIDLANEVELVPYEFKDAEKSKEKGKDVIVRGFNVLQGERKVENYFTKDNKNGLPDAEEKKRKNGKGSDWDFSDQTDFLRGVVKDFSENLK